VDLKPLSGEEEEKVAGEIREILKKFPGIQFEVLTFLGDRIGETITGETAPVVVNVFGEDLDVLDAKAQEVARVLRGVPGNADVQVKSPPGAPRMTVRLRPERLSQFRFSASGSAGSDSNCISGRDCRPNPSREPGRRRRRHPQRICPPGPRGGGSLLLRSTQGSRIPLSRLADIYPSSGRHSILHEGARRRQTITCQRRGPGLDLVRGRGEKAGGSEGKIPQPRLCRFQRRAQAKAKAQRELLLHSAIAGVGILLLLSIVFHNWRNLSLVLANIPFALVGGVLAVWLVKVLGDPGEGGLTIGSLVGFVTLFGITTRNSIMMISHFEHLVNEEGMTWGLETAIRGASERLMPIIMTATVTALGLLPLAIGSGEAGREIEGPMAIVILGGLVTSTLLNLLVLPTLAVRYGRFVRRVEG